MAGDCLLQASESAEDGEALLLLLVLATLLVLPARSISGHWKPPCDEDDEDEVRCSPSHGAAVKSGSGCEAAMSMNSELRAGKEAH